MSSLKLGIHEKYRLCHLSQGRFFSTHSSQNIRHVINGGCKVCFDTPCLRWFKDPEVQRPSFSHTRRISDWPKTGAKGIYIPLPTCCHATAHVIPVKLTLPIESVH
ncbi:hypothetical protein AVEN_72362-1 [Araneus ventricosus]|uniref:Uncharacterized protein n=1 Tax=Araneus ventricosus TaxID=182803 RepID=A0A4Y2MDM1_ARAVE|nr:hypothetical protein AVEN_72362-1 [Araneus ventricosus]